MEHEEVNSFDLFHGAESASIQLWLHRWQLKQQLQGCSDAQTIQHACLHLGPLSYGWFAAHGQHLQSWDQFSVAMLQRFADDEQGLILKLRNRRQQQNESVQAYADALTLLFAQTNTAAGSQRDLFLQNLRPSLQQRVINTCPESLEIAIRHAKFLESQDLAHSPQPTRTWQALKDRDLQTIELQKLCLVMQELVPAMLASENVPASKPGIATRLYRLCGSPRHSSPQCPLQVEPLIMIGAKYAADAKCREELPAYDGSQHVCATGKYSTLSDAGPLKSHKPHLSLRNPGHVEIYQSYQASAVVQDCTGAAYLAYRPEEHGVRRYSTLISEQQNHCPVVCRNVLYRGASAAGPLTSAAFKASLNHTL